MPVTITSTAHLWCACLLLALGGLAYPSNFWHFNTYSNPGPGLSVLNGNVTPGGSLLMDGSAYGLVSNSIVIGGPLTFVFRFFPTSAPANGRFIDFGNGPNNVNIIITFNDANNIDLMIMSNPYLYIVACAGMYQLNQWNTIAITMYPPSSVWFYSNSGTCNWYGMPFSPTVVRNNQYIGKSNWNDPVWTGQLDFVWHIGRPLSWWELAAATAEGDIIGNAWTFQSSTTLPSALSLIGNPDITGGTLNLHANTSQYAAINGTNFIIGGPFSFAARVRMDSYQSWARVLDFSANGVDGIYIGALGATDSAAVGVYRGTQSQTLSCGNFWQLGQWADIFLRVQGNGMELFRQNTVDCPVNSGWEPNNVTRNQLWIGKSEDPTAAGWDGAFQYIWYAPRRFADAEVQYLGNVMNTMNFVAGTQFGAWDSTFKGVGSPTLTNGMVSLSGLASQYIQVNSSLVLSTPFSIAALVYPAVVNRTNSSIFEFGNGLYLDNVVLAQDGNSNGIYYQVTSGGVTQSLRCANFFTYGQWVQVIITHDGLTATIYQQGAYFCSGSVSLSVPAITRNLQYIGKSIDSNKLTWQGSIDYFLVYNRVLNNWEAYANPMGLDRFATLCAAPVVTNPRANIGTCVSFSMQTTTCKLACNSPYVEWSSTPGYCSTALNAEAAVWSSQNISCVARCSNMTAPTNGTLACSGSYGVAMENAFCSFNCSVGFVMMGTNNATCTGAGGGSWTSPAPTCAAVNCSTPVIQYGSVDCSGAFGLNQYTSNCAFSCSSGFTRTGAASSTCLATGQWSAAFPTCVPVTCAPLSLTAGNVTCQNLYGQWTYGSSCAFSCGANYTIAGPLQAICGSNAQWNASLPVCNLVQCQPQTAPVNGGISCDQGAFSITNSVTSKCVYNCTGGYALTNNITQVCLNTGQWSVSSPMCVDINECLTSTTCPYGAQCTNLNGTYRCAPAFTTPVISVNTRTSILPSPLGGNVTFSVYAGFGVTANFNSITYILLSSSTATPILCSNSTLSALVNSVYNVTCQIGQGLGAGFNLTLPYSYLSTSLGVIVSSAFRYPTPTIDPVSLRIVNSTPAAKVFSQTYTTGDIVMFTGTNFLADPTLLSVTYAPFGSVLSSVCTLLLSGCNQTAITCRTQPFGSGLDMIFTVSANGVLVPGTDTFSINNVPNVLSVNVSNLNVGCLSTGKSLYDCPTTGNFPIIIVANYISETFLSGFIGGLNCNYLPPLTNDSNVPSKYFFTCLLPPGTGFNRTVVVAADGKYSQSQNILSYAAPTIFNITGCTQATVGLTATDCPREGGNSLIVIGQNFGADSSSVLVGGVRCLSTTHDSVTPHNRVVCVMPPGFSVSRQVQLYQSAGPFSQSDATVDYAQCGPGTFQRGSATVCGSCQPGAYSSLTGAFTCLPCESGHYAAHNNSNSCPPCPLGTAQPSGGMWNCTICGPGYYTDREASLSCVACDAGTNSSGYGSTGCSACEAGRVTTRSGMDECTPCDEGYAAGPQQSQCQQCPAGTFALQGASACESCQPGYYQPVAGMSFCAACGAGSYSATPGRVDCVPCESGYATNDTAATTCDMCLPGSVSQRDLTSPIGPTLCQPCSPGTYIGIGGQAVCIGCSPGYSANTTASTTCTACDPGHYQSAASSSNCQACPLGSYTALSGRPDCTLCGSGSQSNVSAATSCTPCASGTFSTAPLGGVGVTACSLCSTGSYINTVGQVACFLCATGSAAPIAGASACTMCSAGYYAQSGGAQNCGICLPGRYSGVPGQEVCSQCDAGKYSSDHNATACIDCARGSFQALPGQSFCAFCGTGMYTSVSAQANCSTCSVGKYAPATNSSACLDCQLGSAQAIPGVGYCSGCATGRYTSVIGQSSCNACDPGSYNAGANSSSCTKCPIGSYQNNAGSSSCVKCPVGYSNPATGQSACTACPAGTFSNASGMGTCENCPGGYFQKDQSSNGCNPCQPGTFSSGSANCVKCPDGLVANVSATKFCTFCPPNSAANLDQTRCDCNAGFYLDTGGCQVCPLGTVCVQKGLTRSDIPTQNGYYLSDNKSLTYQKCLSPKSCMAGKCVGFRTGLLCSQCEPGYSMSEWTKVCTICAKPSHNMATMVLTILGILLAVFLLYGYIINSALNAHTKALRAERKSKHAPNASQGWVHGTPKPPQLNHPTTMSQHFSQNNNNSQHVSNMSLNALNNDNSGDEIHPVIAHSEGIIDRSTELYLLNVLKRNDRKHSGDNTYVLKIVVNFFQVASSLIGLPVAGAIAFPTYYMAFLSYFKFFNIDLIPWQNVSCLFPTNFYSKLVVLTVVPAGLIAALAVIVLLATVLMDCRDWSDANAGRQRRQRMRYVFVRGAIFTAFMLYPMISSSILSHFVCLKVGNQTILIADFSIPCYQAMWKHWTPFVIVMTLIYPIGIPVLLFSVLYRNRLDLQSPFASLGLGFLHESYVPRVWWFEVLVMMEKLTLTALLQFLPLSIQLAGGIVVCCAFLITIVLVQPEVRLRNWLLHMLANVEILMLLLVWHFSYRDNITSAPVAIDAMVSALFIGLTVTLVVLMFLDILRYLKKRIFHLVRYHGERKERNQHQKTKERVDGSVSASARPIR